MTRSKNGDNLDGSSISNDERICTNGVSRDINDPHGGRRIHDQRNIFPDGFLRETTE